MSRLHTELARLFGTPDLTTPGPEPVCLVAADGSVRAMVLEMAGPADWAELSRVWQGVQDELALPAAAIAVSGTDGLQLWFSVAEPVQAQEAADFLLALHNRYLPSTPARRIRRYPSSAATDGKTMHAKAVPSRNEGTDHWSAFVSPDLASVFAEEPWLDLPPNADQQADILCRLKPMKAAQFRDAWALLGAPPNQAAALATTVADTGHMHPKAFLMQVMNDPAVGLKDRIEAAKALLPYTRE